MQLRYRLESRSVSYRVEFETDTLVRRAVDAIKPMEKIDRPKIRVSAGQIDVKCHWAPKTSHRA
jgi:hypothetical protein